MSDIKKRLDNVRTLIQEPDFLEGKGLSNEVNIRIFCYDRSRIIYRQSFRTGKYVIHSSSVNS